jgi:hypothetical protein
VNKCFLSEVEFWEQKLSKDDRWTDPMSGGTAKASMSSVWLFWNGASYLETNLYYLWQGGYGSNTWPLILRSSSTTHEWCSWPSVRSGCERVCRKCLLMGLWLCTSLCSCVHFSILSSYTDAVCILSIILFSSSASPWSSQICSVSLSALSCYI